MPAAPPPISAGPGVQAAYQRNQAAAKEARKNGLGARLSGPGNLLAGAPANALAAGGTSPVANMLALSKPMTAAPAASPAPAPMPQMPPNMPPPGAVPPGTTPAPVAAAGPAETMDAAHAQIGAANLSDADLQAHAKAMDGAAHLLGQLIDKGSKVTPQDATAAALGAVKDGVISPQLAGSFLDQLRTGDPAKLADQLKKHLGSVLQNGVVLAQHQQARAGAGAS